MKTTRIMGRCRAPASPASTDPTRLRVVVDKVAIIMSNQLLSLYGILGVP